MISLNGLGHVKVTRDTKHDYLAMILDYLSPGALKIDMQYYIENMLDEFMYEVKPYKTPWNEKLMKTGIDSKVLDEDRKKIFHTYVMKAMFLCKRARPDIELAISFLASRVKEPNESDWIKLLRVLVFF